MSDNLVHVRHTVSGQIADVPQHIYDHDVLGAYLEIVDEDAKPFVPELHNARTADKSVDVFQGKDHSDEPAESTLLIGLSDPINEDDD